MRFRLASTEPGKKRPVDSAGEKALTCRKVLSLCCDYATCTRRSGRANTGTVVGPAHLEVPEGSLPRDVVPSEGRWHPEGYSSSFSSILDNFLLSLGVFRNHSLQNRENARESIFSTIKD